MARDQDQDPLYGLIASMSQAAPQDGMVKRSLQAIRTHLDMEVAYVSEFVGDQIVFREVDAPGLEAMIKSGDARSLDEVYCRHILEGRLPELIPDTATEPVAMAMPITRAVPIGKHMSVPIRMQDGRVYGMFCCLGFKPDHSLHERDMQMMKVFAELAAFEIGREIEIAKLGKEKEDRIRTVIEKNQISMVYQPIWDLNEQRPDGFECLASLSAFPDHVYLAVNASPKTILSGELANTLVGMPAERIVLEITEHAHVDDYEGLLRALEPLRSRGVRLAVDDAGAGFSSLQHILQLRPDVIKLDMALTRHIHLDPARRALASALVAFARNTNSRIVAEGVETALELEALRAIGIEKAQGYFLGRPMPFDDATKLIAPERFTERVA